MLDFLFMLFMLFVISEDTHAVDGCNVVRVCTLLTAHQHIKRHLVPCNVVRKNSQV